MVKLNKFIVAGLEQGRLQELLLGEGEWFLADNTFRKDHDIMLVMFVLLSWVKSISHPQPVVDRFVAELSKLAASNPWNCVDILYAYAITAKDNGIALSFDTAPVLEILRGNLRDDSIDERDAAETMTDLERRLGGIEIKAD